eukprot:6185640-Pleurochrysis_carterae.AAC.3
MHRSTQASTWHARPCTQMLNKRHQNRVKSARVQGSPWWAPHTVQCNAHVHLELVRNHLPKDE